MCSLTEESENLNVESSAILHGKKELCYIPKHKVFIILSANIFQGFHLYPVDPLSWSYLCMGCLVSYFCISSLTQVPTTKGICKSSKRHMILGTLLSQQSGGMLKIWKFFNFKNVTILYKVNSRYLT